MEIGEPISTPSLLQEMKVKCPFEDKFEEAPKNADEDVADDDMSPQANDGGILGDNVTAGTKGKADGGPYPPDDYLCKQQPHDTNRGRKTALQMTEWRDAPAGDYPYTVAAHHLIPGNASLKKCTRLTEFMKDGGNVESVAGKKYTIKGHIGYDINGSHNGIWLPGNYAIKTALPARPGKDGKTLPARTGTTPVPGVAWSGLEKDHEMWQYNYVCSAMKAADGQFHDTHKYPYSASVIKYLGKVNIALALHLDNCKLCEGRAKEIAPPYRIKRRLYAMSKRLRGFVSGTPGSWKAPWFTSQKWCQKYFSGGKLTNDFRMRYAMARETVPHIIGI
jgi:hypothetical protein